MALVGAKVTVLPRRRKADGRPFLANLAPTGDYTACTFLAAVCRVKGCQIKSEHFDRYRVMLPAPLGGVHTGRRKVSCFALEPKHARGQDTRMVKNAERENCR